MARKIEVQMLMAIAAKKNGGTSNTIVNYDDEKMEATVFLFGNKIAVWGQDTLKVSWSGYATPTTTSRINALLFERFGGRLKAGLQSGKVIIYEEGQDKKVYSVDEWITLS